MLGEPVLGHLLGTLKAALDIYLRLLRKRIAARAEDDLVEDLETRGRRIDVAAQAAHGRRVQQKRTKEPPEGGPGSPLVGLFVSEDTIDPARKRNVVLEEFEEFGW